MSRTSKSIPYPQPYSDSMQTYTTEGTEISNYDPPSGTWETSQNELLVGVGSWAEGSSGERCPAQEFISELEK